jgi:hypothetical protein
MPPPPQNLNFIIDCPVCKAKVAAQQQGKAEQSGSDYDGDPYARVLYVGSCPRCSTLLAGESHQVEFEGMDGPEDVWTEVVRVYPKASRTLTSSRIPHVVKESLGEADRCLQVNAPIAACAKFGRALEAVCRSILKEQQSSVDAQPTTNKERHVMLGEGIAALKKMGVIDDRLFEWSQELHAFRNLAAHPGETSISREDAEDLQSFVYTIIEYIYDLADRYAEFKERSERRDKRVRRRSSPIVSVPVPPPSPTV